MFYRKEAKLLARQLMRTGLFQAEPSNLQGLKHTYALLVFSKTGTKAQTVFTHKEYRQVLKSAETEQETPQPTRKGKAALTTLAVIAAALSPESFFEEFKEL